VSEPRGPLAPDPASVAYRHPIAPARVQPLDDLNQTIAALEQRTSQRVTSPMELADLADLYLKRAQLAGDPDDHLRSEAAAKRSLALLRYPSSAPLTLARLASARHDFRAAIALAREHLTHTKSAGALGVLASSHLALGELDHAADAASWAVALRPDSAGYLMSALVAEARGHDADAAADFAHAVRLEEGGAPEDSGRLRALWARFLIRHGERAGAAAVLAEALRIAPAHPLALAQQAELALLAGEPRRAATLFEQAFITARQPRYLIDKARALDAASDRAGAKSTRTLVERLVRTELATHGLGHRLELVEILVDRGDPAALEEALFLARAEVEARPSGDTRFQLARALAAVGDRTEALAMLRAIPAHDARIYALAFTL
jgi:tetratricopeptide (TPR) repeat protein